MTKSKGTELTFAKSVELKFNAMIPEFEKVIGNQALAARFARIATTAVKQNEKLLDCDIPSLMGAVMTAAQVNLEVDPAMGECALVPYFDYKKNKTIVQFQPMYKGILKLVRRSGEVKRVMAHCFYENEVKNGNFKVVYGMKEEIHHEPIIIGDRGALAGAYGVAIMNDGEAVIEVMTRTEIEAIRDGKKKKDGTVMLNPVWNSHEAEMFRKTALKRVCKYLPKSYSDDDKFSQAVQIDNAVDNGKIANVTSDGEFTIDGETGEVTDKPTPATKTMKTVNTPQPAAEPTATRNEQEIIPPSSAHDYASDDMESMFPVG